MRRLPLLSSAVLAFLLSSCGSDSGPAEPGPGDSSRTPAALELTSAVTVDDAATTRLTVTVRDQQGQPFTTLPAGLSVSWASANPGIASVQPVGSGLQADVTGERPGGTQVTASLQNLNASAAVTVRQVAGELVLVSGNGQQAPASSELGAPLVARVLDRHGDGVPQVSVTFAVTSGGGTVSQQTVLTGGDGFAETRWTLGPSAGTQAAQASVQGLSGSPLSWEATALAPFATGTVEGRVTSANGVTPIPGAVVRVLASGGGAVAASAGLTAAVQTGGPETVTDTDGRYVLEGVPAGERTLEATRGVFRAEIPVTVIAGQTIEAPPLQVDASGEIAFVPGVFDSIESIVRNELGTELDELTPADLGSPEVTSRYRFIFINCGVDWGFDFAVVTAAAENLRNYVAGGGALYISDLELFLVEMMFPGDVAGDGGGEAGTVNARVVSPDLRGFLIGNPETVSIVFNLDDWDAVTGLSNRPAVLLDGSYEGFDGPVVNGPLAISLEHDAGQLVYTSFHNNAAATDDQLAVLLFFIYGFGDAAGAVGGAAAAAEARGGTGDGWSAPSPGTVRELLERRGSAHGARHRH